MNSFKDNRQTTQREAAVKLDISQEHDNAGPHTSRTTTEATEKLDLAILPHTPHSQDLAICDLDFLLNMKEDLRGQLGDRLK
jgi:hypothetical protein